MFKIKKKPNGFLANDKNGDVQYRFSLKCQKLTVQWGLHSYFKTGGKSYRAKTEEEAIELMMQHREKGYKSIPREKDYYAKRKGWKK